MALHMKEGGGVARGDSSDIEDSQLLASSSIAPPLPDAKPAAKADKRHKRRRRTESAADGKSAAASALHAAVAKKDLSKAKDVVDDGGDVTAKTEEGRNALHTAVMRQAPRELLSFLLKIKQIDVNERDNHGQTVLHFAASSDRWLTNTAALLEMKNIDVKVADNKGRTPLHVWARVRLAGESEHKRFKKLVALLIDGGADVNARDMDEKTPLHMCGRYGNTVLAEVLVRYSADVNALDHAGRSPLRYAMKYHMNTVCRLLVEHGASVSYRTLSGRRVDLVALCKDDGLRPILLNQRRPSSSHSFPSVQHQKQPSSSRPSERKPLASSSYPGSSQMRGAMGESEMSLHKAVMKNNVKAVEEAIKRGDDINGIDAMLRTPLHIAVFRQASLEVVEALLAHPKIDPNCRDISGMTPYHYTATTTKWLANMAKLCRHPRANLKAVDIKDRTPLHRWAKLSFPETVRESPEMAEFLQSLNEECSADITKKVKSVGDDALPSRFRSFSEEALTSPLSSPPRSRDDKLKAGDRKKGGDGESKGEGKGDAKARRSLHKARTKARRREREAGEGNSNETAVSLSLGENDREEDDDAVPLLAGGASDEVLQCVDQHRSRLPRIESGDSGSGSESRPDTKLRCSSSVSSNLVLCNSEEHRDGSRAAVSRLRISGSQIVMSPRTGHLVVTSGRLKLDVNKVDQHNKTALHVACKHNNVKFASWLLRNYASVRIIDEKGNSPLRTAVLNSHSTMVTLLLENGAPLSYKHNGTKVKFLKECETDSIRELLLKAHEERKRNKVPTSAISPTISAAKQQEINQMLHKAVATSDVARVDYTMQNGADVNTLDRMGRTPLHMAIFRQAPAAVVTLLVAHPGTDPSIRDVSGMTPLHYVASTPKWLANMKILLTSKRIAVKTRDLKGRMAVHRWARVKFGFDAKAQRELYGELCEKMSELLGSDLEWRDNSGKTPLHHCSKRDNTQMAAWLLTKGVKINTCDRQGRSPLRLAVSYSNPNMAKLLLHTGGSVEYKWKGQLINIREECKNSELSAMLNIFTKHTAAQATPQSARRKSEKRKSMSGLVADTSSGMVVVVTTPQRRAADVSPVANDAKCEGRKRMMSAEDVENQTSQNLRRVVSSGEGSLDDEAGGDGSSNCGKRGDSHDDSMKAPRRIRSCDTPSSSVEQELVVREVEDTDYEPLEVSDVSDDDDEDTDSSFSEDEDDINSCASEPTPRQARSEGPPSADVHSRGITSSSGRLAERDLRATLRQQHSSGDILETRNSVAGFGEAQSMAAWREGARRRSSDDYTTANASQNFSILADLTQRRRGSSAESVTSDSSNSQQAGLSVSPGNAILRAGSVVMHLGTEHKEGDFSDEEVCRDTDYLTVSQFLVFNPLATLAIVEVAPQVVPGEEEMVGRALGAAFAEHNSLILSHLCVLREIDAVSTPSMIFRGAGLCPPALTEFFFIHGNEYLETFVFPALLDVLHMLDDTVGAKSLSQSLDVELLSTAVERVMCSVLDSVESLPAGLIYILGFLNHSALDKFGPQAEFAMIGFFFLRFINPVITLPDQHGLVPKEDITPQLRRQLALIAKVIQLLANSYNDDDNSSLFKGEEYLMLMKDCLLGLSLELKLLSSTINKMYGEMMVKPKEDFPELPLDVVDEHLVTLENFMSLYRRELHAFMDHVRASKAVPKMDMLVISIGAACATRGMKMRELDFDFAVESYDAWDQQQQQEEMMFAVAQSLKRKMRTAVVFFISKKKKGAKVEMPLIDMSYEKLVRTINRSFKNVTSVSYVTERGERRRLSPLSFSNFANGGRIRKKVLEFDLILEFSE